MAADDGTIDKQAHGPLSRGLIPPLPDVDLPLRGPSHRAGEHSPCICELPWPREHWLAGERFTTGSHTQIAHPQRASSSSSSREPFPGPAAVGQRCQLWEKLCLHHLAFPSRVFCYHVRRRVHLKISGKVALVRSVRYVTLRKRFCSDRTKDKGEASSEAAFCPALLPGAGATAFVLWAWAPGRNACAGSVIARPVWAGAFSLIYFLPANRFYRRRRDVLLMMWLEKNKKWLWGSLGP